MDSQFTVLKQKVSRRVFLRGITLGGVGLATAAVIGCGDDDEDGTGTTVAPAAPTAAPTAAARLNPSGRLVMGRHLPPPTMDPNSTAGSFAEFHAIYDPLVRLAPAPGGGQLEPAFAEAWELDDADPKTWVFSLRELEWSDGEKATAEDVKFSYEYYADPENMSRLISRVNTFASAKVVDDRTIAITTTNGDPILPRRSGLVFMLPKHIADDPAKDFVTFMGQTPVGTGAYTASNFLDKVSVDLRKSASTWRTTRGLDSIDVKYIGEGTTRLSALEAGEIQFNSSVPTIEAARIGGLQSITVQPAAATGMQGWDLGIDPSADPGPTNDPRVRQAMNYALDRELMHNTVYAGLSNLSRDQLITKAAVGHNPNLSPVPYDPDKARQLIKDAGVEGATVTVEGPLALAPELKGAAESSLGFWEDVGVSIDLRTLETNVWRDRLYGRETRPRPGAFLKASGSFQYEAESAFTWYEDGNAYAAGLNSDDFDATLARARQETDTEKRIGMYWELTEMLRVEGDLVPAAWFVERPILFGWRTDAIGADYTPWSNPSIHFDSVSPA